MKLIKKFQGGKKFSNTPTGRAMQRQYDLEHGITMQKVLPEVEVFPNYYNIDDNGYSNSFAIPLDHRPTTFSQGEISQPYVPRRLDEQGWLNRTFGINNFGLGIMEFISNPANVVPTGETIQGIKTLTSVGNKAKNAGQTVQKVKRVYSTPKVDITPVEGSITTSDVPAITAENATSMTPTQWDAAYSKAIADNNTAEVQRLRDLHFYAKTGETPTTQYRGSSNPTLRNTYYRNDGSAVWFTPNEDAAAFYTPPGRAPRAHYIKTNDGDILRVDGTTTNFDGSPIPSNWNEIPVENIPENVSKHFPEEELSIGNKISFKSKPSYVSTGDVVHAAKLEGYNQVDFQNIVDAKASSADVYPQFTTRYYNNIKLADPITYDDAGNVIPLSQRDNFNNSDIRYGWLPWIFGTGITGYNYLNQDNTSFKYTNGGKLLKRKL